MITSILLVIHVFVDPAVRLVFVFCRVHYSFSLLIGSPKVVTDKFRRIFTPYSSCMCRHQVSEV